MKLFVAVAAVAQLVAAAVDLHSIPHANTRKYVEGSYIVGLNSQSHLKRGFLSPHAELEHDLQRRGVDYVITRVFDNSAVWKGVTIKLGSPSDLIEIAQVAGVTSINRNYLYERPKLPNAALTAPINPVVVDKLTTHEMTGVNRMHGNGVFGKGIMIGIIDTGVDYTHPALGGKLGPGNKIIGGYDFVGDSYTGNGTSDLNPGKDPLDQCSGHGTHVAGIIGANPGNHFNISGVAYEASINAYRIFGCKGGTSEDLIIAAMMRADQDGNDIITMSLGGSDGWTEGATSIIASNLADKGRVLTISAGNDGAYGSWFTEGPATGINVISVGSVDNTINPVQIATDSTGRQIPYSSVIPLANGTFPIYATSTNTSIPNDACSPLPDSTPDLSPYLVLIRRGTCTFVTKLGNAAAKGGKRFLIYDNKAQPLVGIDVGKYKAALISEKDGEYMVNDLRNKNGTITFTDNPGNLVMETGGLVSTFTSYGPTFDMYFKPAISAPGGNILSTYPVPMGSYAVDSGTSMAAPFVAGASALFLQVRGKTVENAKAARAAFQNTASYIPNSKANDSLPETLSHAGAGLIQVYEAAYGTGSMTPAELLLNDTANFRGDQVVTITNRGSKAVTYELIHIPAGTTNTISGIENTPGPVAVVNTPASAQISPSSVTVLPGQSAPVIIKFDPPAGLDAKAFPVYSGFIQAKGNDGSTLHSSYLGVAAALKDMKVLDNTDSYLGNGTKLPLITDQNGNIMNGSTAFSMQGNDTPAVIYRLVAGSPLLRMDLMDPTVNVTTNQRRSFEVEIREPRLGRPKHALLHGATSMHRVHAGHHVKIEDVRKRDLLSLLFSENSKIVSLSTTGATTPTLGNLYSQEYAPRNSNDPSKSDNQDLSQVIFQNFANGTSIPDGTYKVLLQAWRIDNGGVESWLSPEFTIKRAK